MFQIYWIASFQRIFEWFLSFFQMRYLFVLVLAVAFAETNFKAHCSLVIRFVLTGYVALCECANKNCDSQNNADGGGGVDER